MLEGDLPAVQAERLGLLNLVGSEVMRRQVAIEKLLLNHLDNNDRIPLVVRHFIREISGFRTPEDKFCFDLLEPLWRVASQIKHLYWSKMNSGELRARLFNDQHVGVEVLWTKEHFKKHHADAIAKLPIGSREAIEWLLDKSGNWEHVGAVLDIYGEGASFYFEFSDRLQKFNRPLSLSEFFEKFKESIANMGYRTQRMFYSAASGSEYLENKLDQVASITEDPNYHFVQITFDQQEDLPPCYCYQSQTAEDFKRQFESELSLLPSDIRDDFIEFIESHDGPWLERGRITSLNLTQLNTIVAGQRDATPFRYHPLMPAAEFIETVLVELSEDAELKNLVVQALNENMQPWCRYNYVQRIGWHIGGAAQIVADEGECWHIFKNQRVEDFLHAFVRNRNELSDRAKKFMESYVVKHPQYFTKAGLVFDLSEDTTSDQIELKTLISDAPSICLSIDFGLT